MPFSFHSGKDDCTLYCQADSTQMRMFPIDAAPGTPCRTGLGAGEQGACLENQCAVSVWCVLHVQ